MADEEIKDVIETDVSTEVETEETQEEVKTDEEERVGVIENIKNKIKDFVSGGEEEGDDIPDEFTDAARNQGWLDDDIKDFIEAGNNGEEYTDEELKEMIPFLSEESAEKSEDADGENAGEQEEEVEDSQDDEAMQKLNDRIGELEKALDSAKEVDAGKQQEQAAQRASQLFDDMSKQFEVFGKTSELPKFPDGRLIPNSPQLKARSEVWETAQSLQTAGLDFDAAMDTAMDAYKGKHLATEMQRNTIKALKSRETKLSGKFTRHESTKVPEYGPDVINEILRRHGVDN